MAHPEHIRSFRTQAIKQVHDMTLSLKTLPPRALHCTLCCSMLSFAVLHHAVLFCAVQHEHGNEKQ